MKNRTTNPIFSRQYLEQLFIDNFQVKRLTYGYSIVIQLLFKPQRVI